MRHIAEISAAGLVTAPGGMLVETQSSASEHCVCLERVQFLGESGYPLVVSRCLADPLITERGYALRAQTPVRRPHGSLPVCETLARLVAIRHLFSGFFVEASDAERLRARTYLSDLWARPGTSRSASLYTAR